MVTNWEDKESLCGTPLTYPTDMIKHSQLMATKPRRAAHLISPGLGCAASGRRPYAFSRENSMIKKTQEDPLARMLLTWT